MKFPFFFLKQKPIVLDCFTSDAGIYNFSKPALGAKFLPDWWRALPNLPREWNFELGRINTNMKGCTGVIDFFRTGVVLPMWSDLDIIVGPVGSDGYRYQFADQRSSAVSHDSREYTGFADPRFFQHLKLNSPWIFKTTESVEWLASAVPYSMQNPADYTILPGVVNFKYLAGTNVQVLMSRLPESDRRFQISHMTPLYIYHPLSERPVEVKTHLVSTDEIDKVTGKTAADFVFTRRGMHVRKLLKAQEAAKCPFTGRVK